MDDLDRDEILRLFDLRLFAIAQLDDATKRYYEGRIDGHCLQNAIDDDELGALAARHGFRVDWETAMAVVDVAVDLGLIRTAAGPEARDK